MPGMSDDRINLDILVCDQDQISSSLLVPELRASSLVSSVEIAVSISGASEFLNTSKCNTIFIDPIALGLDEASNFIFNTREVRPYIVFVLFLDRAIAESQRDSFYYGRRARFSHYYVLDKRTPISAFQGEIRSSLESCRAYLLTSVPRRQL